MGAEIFRAQSLRFARLRMAWISDQGQVKNTCGIDELVVEVECVHMQVTGNDSDAPPTRVGPY